MLSTYQHLRKTTASTGTAKLASAVDILRMLADKYSGNSDVNHSLYGGVHPSEVESSVQGFLSEVRNPNARPNDLAAANSEMSAMLNLDQRRRNMHKDQFSQQKDILNMAMAADKQSFGGQTQARVAQGLGSMIASPMTGVAKGVESALSAPGTTYGYRLNKMMNSGFKGLMDRIEAPDIAAKKFIESASGRMAENATSLLADMTSKAVSGLTDAMVDAPARKALMNQLRDEDEIIGQMPEQQILDAYHSISKFAPTLSKDKNAVRSALRMAAQSEGGLSYHTIKGLADAEASVTRAKFTK